MVLIVCFLYQSRRVKLQAGPLEEKAATLKKNATDVEADLNDTIKDMEGENTLSLKSAISLHTEILIYTDGSWTK